jgi:anti-sigma factor RsiW
MTGCPDWRVRLQGLIDGELDATHSAEVEAHLADCEACTEAYESALQVRSALRADGVRAVAPAGLLARLDAAVEAAVVKPANAPSGWRRLDRALWGAGGAGLALAACAVLALAVIPAFRTAELEQELVAGHVRSQLVGHLTDVVTSDEHVVKPWFGGKLDFSPPVIDLVAQGFPLVGGRLDYIDKRTVAAIVYRRGRHVINLFVWPGAADLAPAESKPGDGYTLLHWTRGGMTFWAVSDVNEADLKAFQQLLEARTPA